MTSLKYKTHVEGIARLRNDKRDRHGKFRLDANERLSPLPEPLWEKFKAELRQEDVLCYPETEKFYEKLASKLGIRPENLVLTTGVDGAIKNCFELFVRPGDRVIYPDPTFGMLDVYSALFQAEPVKIPFRESVLPVQKVLERLDEKVSLVFLPNPNSPTGHFFPPAEMERLMESCASRGIALLVDEAYWGFSPGSVIEQGLRYDNVAVARSFSKVLGLAGLRVGFVAASEKLAGLLYKFRPMYEVNQMALKLASLILDDFDAVFAYGQETREGRQFFVDSMRERGFNAAAAEANFAYVDFEEKREPLLAYLRDRGVLVRGSTNLESFGNWVRLTVGPVAVMRQLIALLDEGLKQC